MSAEETRLTGYVALVRLPWGEGFLEPGDPVPSEPGRNYGGLLRRRQIGEPAANAAGPISAEVVARELTDHELEEQATARGLHLVPATLPEDHIRTLAARHGLTVVSAAEGQAPVELSLDALRERAAADGFWLMPNDATACGVVEIPAELPAGREGLLQLALSVPVRVTGTGSKGYVKESDLREALEAERGRRAAQPGA